MTQLELSSALQNMCLGYLSVCLSLLTQIPPPLRSYPLSEKQVLSERPPSNVTPDLLRQSTNLDRRFKWTIFPSENPPLEREIFRFDFMGYQYTLAQMKERGVSPASKRQQSGLFADT
jgi:hypothetical protein